MASWSTADTNCWCGARVQFSILPRLGHVQVPGTFNILCVAIEDVYVTEPVMDELGYSTQYVTLPTE
jgi:hypothetical protein